MINAPHDKEFIFHDGTKARNLFDLVSKLESMQDHSFHHFVNAHKNDFASWIEHVFLDKVLAGELKKTTSRQETIEIIKDKISEAAVGAVSIGGSLVKNAKSEDKTEEHHGEHHEMHHEQDREAHHEEHHGEHHEISHHEGKIEETHPKIQPTNQPIINDITHEVHHQIVSETSKKIIDEDRHMSETKIKEGSHDEKENTMWMVLYFALILLIITLLVYKLFL
ncbi:MAG: hypothetical protein ACP5NW_00050 [Candidatus Woesearchaeota archaeon]